MTELEKMVIEWEMARDDFCQNYSLNDNLDRLHRCANAENNLALFIRSTYRGL